MSHTDMDHYRESLEHIVRPEKPEDRREADSVRLQDYEALYLYRALTEFAAYSAVTKEEEEIALGYAEYINDVIRNEGKNFVRIFAHTPEARHVITHAIESYKAPPKDLNQTVQRSLDAEFASA